MFKPPIILVGFVSINRGISTPSHILTFFLSSLNDSLATLQTTVPAITKNTSDWSYNYTKAVRIGDLVAVNVYCGGVPTNGKIIASGLPPADSDYSALTGGATPSVIGVDTNGNVIVRSAGSTSSVIVGGAIIYKATN